MKVFWIGDAIVNSGFSRVTHSICNELSEKCEVVVYGIRYDGKIRHGNKYYIYPAQSGSDCYSFDDVSRVILKENPDVVVIFNDLWVIEQYLIDIKNKVENYEIKARFVPFLPVNYLPIDKKHILNLSLLGVSTVLSYTDFSGSAIRDINPNLDIVTVSHGVDRDIFYPIDDVKKSQNLEDFFVVGNINSNTYRKRLDLFLIGFYKFARNKSDVKCLIHASNNEISYDLRDIAKDLGISDKVIISERSLSNDNINLLYNMLDVNVNTAMGEGFGLTLAEGASCGVPIICSDIGNFHSIWGDCAEYIATNHVEYVSGTTYNGVVIDTDDLASKLNILYENREYLNLKKRETLKKIESPKFNWKTISDNIYNTLCDVDNGRVSVIS